MNSRPPREIQKVALGGLPFLFVVDLITSQIDCCYISCTFYCFGFKFIAIRYIVAGDFLSIQFIYLYISFALYVTVNCTALYALMTHHITVN